MVALAHSLDLFLLKKNNNTTQHHRVTQEADTAPLQLRAEKMKKILSLDITESTFAARNTNFMPIKDENWVKSPVLQKSHDTVTQMTGVNSGS